MTDHWCTPPEHLEPSRLNINLTEWKKIFLPQEVGPDQQIRFSQCSMYEVTNDTLTSFLMGELPVNGSKLLPCTGWTYDQR